MKQKRTKAKVMFNGSERELCDVCGFPHGFCKHTIEDELKELCPKTPLNQEDIWQLVRSHAMAKTEKRNIYSSMTREMTELRREMAELQSANARLRKENEELQAFKKHVKDVINRPDWIVRG
jgi:hypothetical protein